MEIQYFKSAWGDIKNSPGWFGKLCLLALVNFIPVFGQIVMFAYLYGWAREIAWGTHEPLPSKIFSNDDGKFWRRGWFALVITFVFMLIPYVVMGLGNYWQGFGYSYSFFGGQTVNNPLLVGFGGLLSFVGWLGIIVMGVLGWVGIMRMSIYDRLSSGFQFGKIWKMVRHDTRGILKIFGMELLFGLVLGIILSIIIVVLVVIVVSAGIAGLVSAGYAVSPDAFRYMTDAQSVQMLMRFFASAGMVGFFALLLGTFVSFLAVLFVEMLVARAMGYWTMQFDVPRWGGQDDPMPFELFEERQARQQPQRSQQSAESAPVAPVATPVAEAEPEVQDLSVADSPAVTYDEPITVGASFIMTPDEIAEAEAAADIAESGAVAGAAETSEAAASESTVEPAAAPAGFTFGYSSPSDADAQGAHGVEDGQAGDPDVGEDR